MACENDGFLRPFRPFPNDPIASCAACAEVCEVQVAGVEALTRDYVQNALIEAARRYQAIRFVVVGDWAHLSLEDIGRIYDPLKDILAEFLTSDMLGTFVGGVAEEGKLAFSVELYDFSGDISDDLPPEEAELLGVLMDVLTQDPDAPAQGEESEERPRRLN